jgi:hypothetical protein
MMGVRRMHTDASPSQDISILIMDNATDIIMVGKGFELLFHSGDKTTLWGVMASLEGKTYDIVTAAAVVECPTSTQQFIVTIHQAAYVPNNNLYKSLLHTGQERYHNVIVNDLSKYFKDGYGNAGRQSIEADGFEIPLQHDGSKYFLTLRPPTDPDWEDLPIVTLTSPTPWDQHDCLIRHTRKNKEILLELIKEWSNNSYVRAQARTASWHQLFRRL